ncbi:hypothetical protein MRB53_041011 [Persea americana]|nr:hypothetical protein MRB53_041011 [Persea americana]
MYEFVVLTDEQRHERRILLDQYATLAQLSACLPILLIYSSILLSAGYERWLRRSPGGAAASHTHKPTDAPLQLQRESSDGHDDAKVHTPEEEIDLDAEDVYSPSSPQLKFAAASWTTRQSGAGKTWARVRRDWRRAAWWCGEPVDIPFLNEHLGSRGEVLGAFVWFVWLIAVSFVQTGNGESFN